MFDSVNPFFMICCEMWCIILVCIKCSKNIPDGSAYCNHCGARQSAANKRRSRGNGEGSIYKSDGKWRATITVGFEVRDGQLHQIRKSKCGFDKKQDARDWITANMPELKQRAADRHNPGITLRQLYDEWFPTHRAGKSTMDCYKAAFKVFADVVDYPMEEQDVDDLQECLDSCGKGRRTKENARACLGLVYKYGIPRNCIPKDRNLAQYLDVGDHDESRGEGLNDIELSKIRKLAENGDTAAVLVYCHCYLGFRPAAFISLRVADYIPAEKAFVGGIKTTAGRGRTVTVSPKIQPYVDTLLSRSADCVFTTTGKPLRLKEYRSLFYSVLERCGIDNPVDDDGRHRLTPHSCRHTFATLMKRVSGSDTDKLALIGHTSTEQLRYYQDVSYSDLRRITDAI